MLRLTEATRTFFNAASVEVMQRLMEMAPGDLARTTAALVSVGMGSTKLLASVARGAVARADRFTTAQLISLVEAFERARCYHTALFEAAKRSLKANVKDVAPKDVLRCMLSLAACGMNGEGLAQVVGDLLPKTAIATGVFTAEESCSLAWAFCALDLYHDKLFQEVFSALEDSPLQSNQALCQLYEIHLTLKAFHHDSYKDHELEDDTVQSLREHYRAHRADSPNSKLERTSDKCRADLAETLRQVLDASASAPYSTSLGLSVDVAATSRSRRSSSTARPPVVLLDVDGSLSLIRSLDPNAAEGAKATLTGEGTPRVPGTVALKRRLLRQSGLRMVVIAEERWNGFEGSRERREFLRNTLRSAGVDKDRFL